MSWASSSESSNLGGPGRSARPVVPRSDSAPADLGLFCVVSLSFLTIDVSKFRAYDPSTGRWLSRDPIGEKGGLNLYGYVGNNPIRLVDPFGQNVYITTYTRGVMGLHPHRTKINTLSGLKDFLANSADGSIAKFEAHGHMSDVFGTDEIGNPRGSYWVDGRAWYFGGNFGTRGKPDIQVADLAELISRKMAKGGIVHLGGCFTSIQAEKVSGVLPGIAVEGVVGVGYVYTGDESSVDVITQYERYVDGVKKGGR
jgi:hypothetical protein